MKSLSFDQKNENTKKHDRLFLVFPVKRTLNRNTKLVNKDGFYYTILIHSELKHD
jgi:hypothetical protein